MQLVRISYRIADILDDKLLQKTADRFPHQHNSFHPFYHEETDYSINHRSDFQHIIIHRYCSHPGRVLTVTIHLPLPATSNLDNKFHRFLPNRSIDTLLPIFLICLTHEKYNLYHIVPLDFSSLQV